MTKLRLYAFLGLIFNLSGYFINLRYIFSIAGFIASVLVCQQLEAHKLTHKIVQLYIIITGLSFIVISLVSFEGVYYKYLLTSSMRIFWFEHYTLFRNISLVIAYLLCLLIGLFTYKLSTKLFVIAKETQMKSFKITAIITRVAAYTMPLLIGILIQAFAQLIMLVAAILYKSDAMIENNANDKIKLSA